MILLFLHCLMQTIMFAKTGSGQTREKTATDKKRTDFADNTHGLMAMVGAVGECQLHFPELVHTLRPWQSVMDKAAFI